MRAYVLDELSGSAMEKIRRFLHQNAIKSPMSQVYWIRVPEDILSQTQHSHKECSPHVLAVELGKDWVRFEFFVRSLQNLRCTCPGYCTAIQQEFVIGYVNRMIEVLEITT